MSMIALEIGMINWRWLRDVALDWTIIICAIIFSVSVSVWWLYLLSILVIGTRQHALAFLGHDGSHLQVSSNRKLNDWLTCLLCFWPLLVSLPSYRSFHIAHHRNTNIQGKDPELPLKEKHRRAYYEKHNRFFGFTLDLLGRGVFELLDFQLVIKPKTWREATPVIIFQIVFVGIFAYCSWAGLVEWCIAIYTSFWAVFRLRIFSEHNVPPYVFRFHRPAIWERLLYAPHSTMWLHWEHHEWPGLRGHQLLIQRKEHQ